ncbi:MAG: glycosyltransferase [bacterium]|nr:glycosyltransferase [bacterium]
MKAPPRIAVFIFFSGQGGVERMITNLAQGFLDTGFGVDMVQARTRAEHLDSIPEGVRQIRLGTKHTFSTLPGLARHLRRENPSALLAAKDRAIKVAILARWLSGSRVRLVGRIGTTVSEAISGKNPIRRWLWYTGMRLFYPSADHIVAVSEGVARDLRSITGIAPTRITAVRNPVVSAKILEAAAEPVEHPWFICKEVPVILGMGRLTEQKDFGTLVKAFGLVKEERPCKLIILGEGRQRNPLREIILSLGLGADVDLPGFMSNPHAWMSRSSFFVLSSRGEGSPNVLTEALALGVPSVSTDCPSGPREVLAGGKFGPLVSVGDHIALALAMEQVLDNPLPPGRLKEAAEDYSVEKSTMGYLDALGIRPQ